MKNKALMNIACSALQQIVAIISGLVVPRLILSTFGSEANGLISSLTQFLNYIALVEGGIGSVILTAMYGPLAREDNDGLSRVMRAARPIFNQIAYIFAVYTAVLAIVYPFIIRSSFSWLYISSLTVILSMSLMIQYLFAITYRLLLQADQKMYIVQIWQIVISILNLIVTVVTIKIYPQLHFVKLCSVSLFVIQPIVYSSYVKKHYNIRKDVPPDQKTLSQRWAGFGQNFAYFIHSNTDIIVLSLFCDLKTVSVYSVYSLVIKHLQGFFKSFSHAFSPIIGKDIAMKDFRQAGIHVDIYEFVLESTATIVFGCCIYLLPDFVLLYTHGVDDVNYFRPVFSTVIILSEYINCIREPYLTVVFAAGRFRETAASAYTEAFINIALSVLLVRVFGLEGVAVGTLIGMLYRMFYLFIYVDKHVMQRSVLIPMKRLAISLITMLSSIAFLRFISRTGSLSFYLWFKNALNCGFVFTVFTIAWSFLLDYKATVGLIKLYRNK